MTERKPACEETAGEFWCKRNKGHQGAHACDDVFIGDHGTQYTYTVRWKRKESHGREVAGQQPPPASPE